MPIVLVCGVVCCFLICAHEPPRRCSWVLGLAVYLRAEVQPSLRGKSTGVRARWRDETFVPKRSAVAKPDIQRASLCSRDRKSTRLNSSHYCAYRLPPFACKNKHKNNTC